MKLKCMLGLHNWIYSSFHIYSHYARPTEFSEWDSTPYKRTNEPHERECSNCCIKQVDSSPGHGSWLTVKG